MSQLHQPLRLAEELRTIFENPNTPIGFFLGAGCPSSITTDAGATASLIDDIAGLTKRISDRFSSDNEMAPTYNKLFDTLVADGCEKPNIEDLLTRIRQSKAVVGKDAVRGLTAVELRQLEAGICDAVSEYVNVLLPDDSPYHSIARLIQRKRSLSTEIFTTNYDLLTEQALESLRVPFFDGFVGSYCPFFDRDAIERDPLPKRWVRLWKLHGSINWRLRNDHVYRIVPSSTKKHSSGDDVLIHPSHLKYVESQRMPYVAMFDRLKTYIHNDARPIALFVIGYSFSDEHLNATLTDSLRANPRASCYAFQYENLDRYNNAIDCANRTSNLNVLAPDGAILDARRGNWAPCREDNKLLKLVFEPRSISGDATTTAEHRPDDNSVNPDLTEYRLQLGNFVQFGKYLDDLGHQVGRYSNDIDRDATDI